MHFSEECRWFALRVRSNHEKLVAAGAVQRGFESFLPLYRTRRRWSDRWKDIDLPLFTGYVFCRLNLAAKLPLLTIPGVAGFAGAGRVPIAVADEEIAALQSIVRSGAPAAPWPFLKAGQRVRLERGPIRDVEGILIEVKNSLRLVVSVTLLQRSVAVEVDRDSVCPIGPRRPREADSERPRFLDKLQIA